MKSLAKIIFTVAILMGSQALVTSADAAHRGGGVDNGFGPGQNSGGGNGNGNNGNGNGGSGGGATSGGAASSGGAQGAPAPILAASILGQAIAFGGGFLAWRRRKYPKT